VPEATGFVPPAEIGRYYGAASVVCVPSRREGYGMTAREALVHGRPVVAARVGGLRDLEGHGVVLVPSSDRGALRAAIVRLLVDPRERALLGRLARARAAEFDLTLVSQRLTEVYRCAVATGTSSYRHRPNG
jgi:glycosyltransferase involved in cell wall biosynthesis